MNSKCFWQLLPAKSALKLSKNAKFKRKIKHNVNLSCWHGFSNFLYSMPQICKVMRFEIRFILTFKTSWNLEQNSSIDLYRHAKSSEKPYSLVSTSRRYRNWREKRTPSDVLARPVTTTLLRSTCFWPVGCNFAIMFFRWWAYLTAVFKSVRTWTNLNREGARVSGAAHKPSRRTIWVAQCERDAKKCFKVIKYFKVPRNVKKISY